MTATLNIFDLDNFKVKILYGATAFITVAAMIMGVLGIVSAKTTMVLPGMDGKNPSIEQLLPSDGEPGGGGIPDPDSEVRGVWIASVNNINFPSVKGLGISSLKSELDAIVAECAADGINAIFFQVRPCSDALYASTLFPSSEYLTGAQGKDIGFDALGYLTEAAHAENIKVHAWVNPVRVTFGNQASLAHDTSVLAENNPARLHPEYTVAYADGKLYYNLGLPEVRTLIADGVHEIVENYAVDGVVFDDYFYPYTVKVGGKTAEFDDAAAYKTYGNGKALADWRRENVNALVKLCYDTVKSVRGDCSFGVSPFGIRLNDDGSNGGSDTSGLEAYNELYCDAKAWIDGGYIDYIAPQIYWSFTNKAARYDTLTRYWNSLCDGTDVDLLISHAAYRYSDEWAETPGELSSQIEFARSELTYRGSILYGYAALKSNSGGLRDEIRRVYSENIIYSDPVPTGEDVTLSSPANGSTLSGIEKTYLLGQSDPAYPLYYNGKKVSRTKSGYYSLSSALVKGKNTIVLSQNGKDFEFILYNGASGQSGGSTGGAVSYPIMEKFEIIPITPTSDAALPCTETLSVSVKAPSGSKVVCKLGEISVELTAQGKAPGTDKLYEEIYSGRISLANEPAGSVGNANVLNVTAVKGKQSATTALCSVRALGANAVIPIEVTGEHTPLKVATDSYSYDDFTSQAPGMRDNAKRLENGFYLLRVGGYVAEANVKELDAEVPTAKVTAARLVNEGEYTCLYLDSDTPMPMNGRVENGEFILNVYNTDISSRPGLTVDTGDVLFKAARSELSTKANCFRYHLTLADPLNFYGFDFKYSGNTVIVRFKNPSGLADSDKPLEGKTIVIDAGHGGYDAGASGASPIFKEAQVNLGVAIAAEKALAALGAQVVMTRTEDEYLALTERMNDVETLTPDLSISVHQNSMEYNVDVSKVRGLVALYWEYAGYPLAESMAESLSASLGRYNRGAAQQRLAMVRCERYPSVLIELGFMTSAEELESVTAAGGFERAGAAIADAVLDYYRAQAKWCR